MAMFERVQKIIATLKECEPEDISPNSDLVNDLGFDSAEAIAFIAAVEKEFDLVVNWGDNLFAGGTTICNIMTCIKELLDKEVNV